MMRKRSIRLERLRNSLPSYPSSSVALTCLHSIGPASFRTHSVPSNAKMDGSLGRLSLGLALCPAHRKCCESRDGYFASPIFWKLEADEEPRGHRFIIHRIGDLLLLL